MMGYFNGNNQTVFTMLQGVVQTLLVRLPLAYTRSNQPDTNLTKIGIAAPVSTAFGVVLCTVFYLYFRRKEKKTAVLL